VFLFSFTDFQLGSKSFNWIGFTNFAKIAQDTSAHSALYNTFAYAAMVVPLSVTIGLILAVAVSGRRRLRRPYELFLFLPMTATMTVMAIVWSLLLDGQIGPINAILQVLGLAPVDFLGDPDAVLPSLAVISVWQQTSFCFVVFLAGLTSIPAEIYEAAALDKLGRGWEPFRRITWPMLAPTTIVVVLLTTIKAFQVFDVVAVLTQGGPNGASEVLLHETYIQAFSYFRIGYGSALTMVFIVVVGLVSALQMLIGRRKNT
jgi:multiple sugar transport system permease protein